MAGKRPSTRGIQLESDAAVEAQDSRGKTTPSEASTFTLSNCARNWGSSSIFGAVLILKIMHRVELLS